MCSAARSASHRPQHLWHCGRNKPPCHAEALTRLLAGDRRWRREVDFGATIYKIMESIAKDTRKQAKNSPIDRFAVVSEGGVDDSDEDAAPHKSITAIATGNPEAVASFNEIFALLSGSADGAAEEAVLLCWAEGLSGKEAVAQAGITTKDYDAARKRLERKVAAIKKQTEQ